jgi:hypothetical protein
MIIVKSREAQVTRVCGHFRSQRFDLCPVQKPLDLGSADYIARYCDVIMEEHLG